jgi:hypothetical protein
MYTEFYHETDGRDNLGNLSIYWMIILKWALKELGSELWIVTGSMKVRDFFAS